MSGKVAQKALRALRHHLEPECIACQAMMNGSTAGDEGPKIDSTMSQVSCITEFLHVAERKKQVTCMFGVLYLQIPMQLSDCLSTRSGGHSSMPALSRGHGLSDNLDKLHQGLGASPPIA